MTHQTIETHHYNKDDKVILVSDIHVQDDQDPLGHQLIHFLRLTASDATAIYILGDLFNYWAGDACHHRYSALFQSLHQITQHCPVFMMPGNRDFLITQQRLSAYGVTKINDPIRITLADKVFLLTHGDQLCIHDLAYLRLRRFIQHPLVIKLIHMLPYAWCLASCHRMRKKSHQATRVKPAHIMHPDSKAMQNWLDTMNAKTLIFGHIHQLQTINFSSSEGCALVMDSWENQPNYCMLTAGSAQLHVLSIDSEMHSSHTPLCVLRDLVQGRCSRLD
jgi:UDP-2,3-diacylglucosamine hydrolase